MNAQQVVANKPSADAVPSVIEATQEHLQKSGRILGKEVSKTLCDHGYTTLTKSIPEETSRTGTFFIGSLDGRLPLTHAETKSFVHDFGNVLHAFGVRRGHRVALVLPNGSELALALLAVSQWASCVPLNANSGPQEIKADLERAGADVMIGPYCASPIASERPKEEKEREDWETRNELADRYHILGNKETANEKKHSVDWTNLSHVQDAANDLGIPYIGLVPNPVVSGLFRLVRTITNETATTPIRYDDLPDPTTEKPVLEKVDTDSELRGRGKLPLDKNPNTGSDEALVLFTSGTTGQKKLVPHQIRDILTAAVTIALSWDLKPTNGESNGTDGDVNCNLMPLFHVGGIIRQVYSPLISGTGVICCPSFDTDIYWSLLQKRAFNWYYASPTMHQALLKAGKFRKEDDPENWSEPSLRMIANAAGGLLPSLAEKMRDFYQGAAVLPSYGMTECMPISSPPANYNLSKPGTSGIPVGPEVAIMDTETNEEKQTGEEGAICVRGDPCFRGYGQIANDLETKPPQTFLNNEAYGWFDTGDRGYLDSDGYLYVTGRSKEAINRGGETIAPMEIEEEVQKHPDVHACAAFAADHDVLQEVVGIVVVLEDEASPRKIDLPSLQEFLADKLAQAKWPQCIVYMKGGLPKSQTNKLLRVKLGKRLGLPTLSDSMTAINKTFEADCPSKGTPLSESINSSRVQVDPTKVEVLLRKKFGETNIWVREHPTRSGAIVCFVLSTQDRRTVIEEAQATLDRYSVPSHFTAVEAESDIEPMSEREPSPEDATKTIINGSGGVNGSDQDPISQEMQRIFSHVLSLDYIPSMSDNFFNLGGSSMEASQLASEIRKSFKIPCSGSDIFHNPTLGELCSLAKGASDSNDGEGTDGADYRDDHGADFAEKHIPKNSVVASLVQLFPAFVMFPLWQVTRYLLFFAFLLWSFDWLPTRNLGTFVLAFYIFHLLWIVFTPLIFVAIKWLVIGRYRAGRYPIWGSYYLRWWFVDVCRKLFLRGFWGSTDWTLTLYYRMLGAQIGKNVRIQPDCDIAEFDLVTVDDGAAVESGILRGFGVDNGSMMLGSVRVGRGASLGLRSIVSPQTEVCDFVCM